jgi:hypothetical protein
LVPPARLTSIFFGLLAVTGMLLLSVGSAYITRCAITQTLPKPAIECACAGVGASRSNCCAMRARRSSRNTQPRTSMPLDEEPIACPAVLAVACGAGRRELHNANDARLQRQDVAGGGLEQAGTNC